MEVFREIMRASGPFGAGLFGAGIAQLMDGYYKSAAYILLITSILYLISYFAERWSK